MRWHRQLGRRAWEQNKREPEAADCCSPLCCSAPHFSSMISSYLLCSALNLCSALPQRLQSVGTPASALCCLVLRCMARGGGLNGRVMGGWGSARSPHSSPLRLRSLHLSTSEGGHLPTYIHLGDQPFHLGIGRQPLRGTFHVSTSWEQLHHFCISKTSSPPLHL